MSEYVQKPHRFGGVSLEDILPTRNNASNSNASKDPGHKRKLCVVDDESNGITPEIVGKRLLPELLSGTGLNEWRQINPDETRACESCDRNIGLSAFSRSTQPNGPIEFEHTQCNYCTYTSLTRELTKEEFFRKYLGFKGTWATVAYDPAVHKPSARLWQPKK